MYCPLCLMCYCSYFPNYAFLTLKCKTSALPQRTVRGMCPEHRISDEYSQRSARGSNRAWALGLLSGMPTS